MFTLWTSLRYGIATLNFSNQFISIYFICVWSFPFSHLLGLFVIGFEILTAEAFLFTICHPIILYSSLCDRPLTNKLEAGHYSIFPDENMENDSSTHQIFLYRSLNAYFRTGWTNENNIWDQRQIIQNA